MRDGATAFGPGIRATNIDSAGLRIGGRTPLSAGEASNDRRGVDFNSEFKFGTGRYGYPLTATDIAGLGLPVHDRDIPIIACGGICVHRKEDQHSGLLAGQELAIKGVDEGPWPVSYDNLGYTDVERERPQLLDPRLSSLS